MGKIQKKMRGKEGKKIGKAFAIILLFLGALTISLPGLPDFKLGNWEIGRSISELKINLGPDLQGGTYLVYKADLSQLEPDQYTDSLEGVRDVIERRVNAFGIAEPIIYTSHSADEYRINIELAGIKDVNEAIKMIGETPILEFKEVRDKEEAKWTSEEAEKIKVINQSAKERAQKVLEEAKKGEKDFAELAKEHSEDPSATQNGGDLGFFKKGMMVPAFDEAVFKDDFKKGEVYPELVKSDFGYHIIKKIDERGEGEDREVQAMHILFATKNEEYNEELLYADPFKQTGLTGKQLDRADVVFDPNTGAPQVSLTFDAEGRELFRQITERNLEKTAPIFLDGEMITNPTVQAVITDGRAVITGNFSLDEAKKLARRLNEGALPVPVSLIHQKTVGASLGKDSLEKSLMAGAIGFMIVSFFMVAIYGFSGAIAVFALSVYALLLVSLFKLIGITLTLSGIAGLILSVGMAVDANILIFERIREELLVKRRMSVAIAEGFRRAWPSIRDGNVSTVITCLVLMFVSTGMVRGFATALLIGVLLSMFSAIFVTRVTLEIFSRDKEQI